MNGVEWESLNEEPESQTGDRPPYDIVTTASTPWAPARIIDTESMPWAPMRSSANADAEAAKYPFSMKNLFLHKDTNERLMILYVPPGWPGGYLEYHTNPEWAFNYYGDIPNNDGTCSAGHIGLFNRFKEV